jgi:ligand-binding sensor domain-containing protein
MYFFRKSVKLIHSFYYLFALIILFIFIYGCEREVFVGVSEVLSTNYGKVLIISNPPGYKIFVDSKNQNVVTPDSVLWLSEGTHKIELRNDLFIDSTFNIVVSNTSLKTISVNLFANPNFYAQVSCVTIPIGAKIYINNKLSAFTTPAIIKGIFPDKYKIKFTKSNCREDSITTLLKGGETVELVKVLEDTTYGVSYRTTNTKIPSNYLSKVAIDKYGNKWIGSLDHGLIKYDGKTFTSYEDAGILSSKHVTDIFIDSKNRIWVGSTSGLCVYDGVNWKRINDEITFRHISQIEEDSSGTIWFATLEGLMKYDNSTYQIFNTSNSKIQSNIITCLTVAPNGEIFYGTDLVGVCKYFNGVWTNYSQLLSLTVGLMVVDILFDKEGNLWSYQMGDLPVGGIIKYNTTIDRWDIINIASQSQPLVVSFYVDNNNTFWIACSNGLFRYNEKKSIAKYYNTSDLGFYSKNCSSLQFDSNGDLWITTNGGGLIKLKKNSL